jgi:4-aminobutyrate aminotransferase-like enzyme
MTGEQDFSVAGFVARNRPALPQSVVRGFAERAFGLAGELTALASERDQNTRIDDGEGGAGVVLKISSADEQAAAIDYQVSFLEHVAAVDPAVPVPRVVRDRDGAPWTSLEAPGGTRHLVHCLTYMPGEVHWNRPISRDLAASLGATLARLDKAARGFHHPAAAQALPWHMHLLPRLAPCLAHINDAALARDLEAFMTRFEDKTLPALARLRAQSVHHDANGPNILVDGEDAARIAGVIDFGDSVHATLAAEIAVPGCDLVEGPQALDVLCELVSAYDRDLPLERDEIDIIPDLIRARVCATLLVIAARNDGAQADGYMAQEFEPYRQRWQDWSGTDDGAVRRALARACGYPDHAGVPGGDGALVERRRALLGHALGLSYARPVHVERGAGVWLFSPDGERFLDAYNNVPQVGHAHAHVVRAVARQAAALNTNTRYLFGNIVDYAERLTALLPDSLETCSFVNSGSEANDTAWRMACHATGHRGAIVMEHAWHGITEATSALSPYGPATRARAAHVRTLAAPDPYRAGHPVEAGDYAADIDRAIAELGACGHGVAAFVVDSGFTSNGIPDVPPGYLALVCDKVRAAGGLVIADEVQMGFARPGTHFWGFETHGIHPDMVTMGKPIGNGYPLGVVVTSRALRDGFGADTDFFSTFGGNPVGCAAGLAVLDVIAREGLQERARDTGDYLRERLRALSNAHALIGDVRGRGLLVGVELVQNRGSRRPAPEALRAVLDHLRDDHVLVGTDGPHGNVMKIRPPLAFGREHADMLVEAMGRALTKVAR